MSVQSVALASLTATYTDSEGEDGVDDYHQPENCTPKGSAPQNAQVSQPQAFTSPKSGRSASNSPKIASGVKSVSNLPNNLPTSVTDVTSKVQRLVSYTDDTLVSDDEGTATAKGGLPVENGLPLPDQSPSRQADLVSDAEAEACGVVIPPKPSGQYPLNLQTKIDDLFRSMESGKLDMNSFIQKRKNFRNPSIYEKLIQFCEINEFGTNYPPECFDPLRWGKESYYEELAKIQKTEMDKLDKARKEKTKIEIVSGTAKRPSSSANSEDDSKKRKSKWDQVATGATSLNSTLVSLSQPTVISAFGSLPKKRL